MSTSEGAPLEQEPCDTCSSTAGGCAECQPLRVEGPARFIRADAAEATLRAEIEPYGERSRRLRFPWVITACFLGSAAVDALAIWFGGHGLGWW